jgi:hypothetical protein
MTTPRREPLTGFLADLEEARRRAVWAALRFAAMAAAAWWMGGAGVRG